MRLNIHIFGETATIQAGRGGLFMSMNKSKVAACVASLDFLNTRFPEIAPLIFMSEFVSGHGGKSLIDWSKKMNPVMFEAFKNQFIAEIGSIDDYSAGDSIEYRLR